MLLKIFGLKKEFFILRTMKTEFQKKIVLEKNAQEPFAIT